MRALSASEQESIRKNLFPGALRAIEDWNRYPWHRYRGRISTGWIQSSQALSIDVFGFLKARPQSERDVAVGALAARLGLPPVGPWQTSLEVNVGEELLGEPRPTQLDALVCSPRALIAFECKFTETGSACSRPTGRNKECSGAYVIEPGNHFKGSERCALTAKGVRYWEHVPTLFPRVASDRDHDPCPFADDRYQWMRNLAAARALGAVSGRVWGVMVVFADGGRFPAATKDWAAFVNTLDLSVRFAVLSYQDLLAACEGAVAEAGVASRQWAALRAHVRRKVATVASN